MPRNSCYSRIIDILTSLRITAAEWDHAPVFTVAQAEHISGHQPNEGTKCLALIGKNKERCVLTVSGEEYANFHRVEQCTGIRRLRMCPASEVEQSFGAEIGGLAPFGYDEGVTLAVSAKLFLEKKVYFNAGLTTKTMSLSASDFEKVLKALGALVLSD